MAKEIKKKVTFGGCDIDYIRPAPKDDGPTAMNVVISFEDALKLHLSLGQVLAKLNSYNRSTKSGKLSAVNLCVFPKKGRMTVNEDKLRTKSP